MPRIQIVDTIIEKDGKFLMLKRMFSPRNKYDFPGGFVEDGETFEEAAIRETKEESGYDVSLVKKLGRYDYFHKKEKTTHFFIGEIIGGDIIKSLEGLPEWLEIGSLDENNLAFPDPHLQAINDYLKIKK